MFCFNLFMFYFTMTISIILTYVNMAYINLWQKRILKKGLLH